jgi:hypothetical protein
LPTADSLTPLELFTELLQLVTMANLPDAERQRALELVNSIKTRLSISEGASTDHLDSSRKYHALRGNLDGLKLDYDSLDTSDRLHNPPQPPPQA